MKLKVSWASSRNRRKENQDNLSIGEQAAFPEGIEERHISGQVLMDIREDNEVLFAAADGLGGCTNGKYAAARCLEVLRESFYSFYNTATETEAEEQTALCEPLHTCTTGESPLPVLRPVSQLLPLRAASLEYEEEAEPAPSRLMAAAMEARDALADAVALGLISGTTDGNGTAWLSPQSNAAREQSAAILTAFCENVK